MKSLDKRYRTKYGMSEIDNLNDIAEIGIRKFLESEDKKWVKGDKILCVHDGKYYQIE